VHAKQKGSIWGWKQPLPKQEGPGDTHPGEGAQYGTSRPRDPKAQSIQPPGGVQKSRPIAYGVRQGGGEKKNGTERGWGGTRRKLGNTKSWLLRPCDTGEQNEERNTLIPDRRPESERTQAMRGIGETNYYQKTNSKITKFGVFVDRGKKKVQPGGGGFVKKNWGGGSDSSCTQAR